MNFLQIQNKQQVSISFALKTISFVCICFLAWLWGYKTSGVLENTMQFATYPLGYSYLLQTEGFGLWHINRESIYYLNGMQAFLNVPNAVFTLGNGYELARTMYCLILRSFWFLEPVAAAMVLDIILWFGAAISSAYVTATFSKNKLAPWLALGLVVFGQGFLHSVGEGVPHVLGYVAGFYIAGILCYFRTWQKECSFGEDLVGYLFLAVFQLGYGTALFFLPLPLFCTFVRLKQNHTPLIKQFLTLGVFSATSLLPFLLISGVMRVFSKYSGETQIVLDNMRKYYSSIFVYLCDYLKVFIDGILSLGPWITISVLWLSILIVKKPYRDLRALFLIFLIQYAFMIFLIVPLPGRGYATFNLIMFPTIFLAIVLADAIQKMKPMAFFASLIFALIIVYPHTMKVGYRLPNLAFQMGWFQKMQDKWQTYEIHTFK